MRDKILNICMHSCILQLLCLRSVEAQRKGKPMWQQVPLHNIKVGVWYATRAHRIKWICVFSRNNKLWILYGSILSSFFGQLTTEVKSYGHFMQDNATAHTANHSMDASEKVFGEWVLRQGLWALCIWMISTVWKNLQKMWSMKFLLFLYNSSEVCLETWSHDMRHP
jgi:hypothetical protein